MNTQAKQAFYKLMTQLYEYPHELSEDDIAFLDKKAEEISKIPLYTLDDLLPSENTSPRNVSPENLKTATDYLMELSDNAFPTALDKINLREFDEFRLGVGAILVLANACIIGQRPSVTDENDDFSDEFIAVLDDFAQ